MTYAAAAEASSEVDAATSGWSQGDGIEIPAVVWLGLPDLALTAEIAGAPSSPDSDVAVALAAPDAMVVLSQTCDIVRACSERSYVTLALLVRLQEPAAGEARRGHRPRFVPVPGLGEDAFCDLDIVMTVEKSVLARCRQVRGLRDDGERRRFSLGVARAYSRAAFPDDLVLALRPLTQRIRSKHDRNSAEGVALAVLEQIRATATPSWDDPQVHVFLTFAPGARAEADATMTQEQWDGLVDGWLGRIEPVGVIVGVDGAMIPLDELTAREYLDSDQLDLDQLSWEQPA